MSWFDLILIFVTLAWLGDKLEHIKTFLGDILRQLRRSGR